MMDSTDNGALPTDRATTPGGAEPVVSGKAGIPSAIRTSELQFGGLTMKVHHLDNGQRVIDAESIADFFAALENGTLLLSQEDADAFARAVRL